MGIRERTGRRRIHDYRLVELIDDVEADRDTGVAYQDFLVEHANVESVRRRLRLYPLERNASTQQREVAARAAKREFEYLFRLNCDVAGHRGWVSRDIVDITLVAGEL